jgi:hypothetical protein
MANAEAAWKRVAREVPFDGEFSESIIKELYEAEEARAKTFAGFALLAVDRCPVSACSAVAAFTRRTGGTNGDRIRSGWREEPGTSTGWLTLAVSQAVIIGQPHRIARGGLVADAGLC